MANIWFTGFEAGVASGKEISSGTGNMETAVKRSGNYSYSIYNGSSFQKGFPGAYAEIYLQFAFRPTDYGYNGDNTLVKWMKNGTVLGVLTFNRPGGHLSAYTGDMTTKVISGSTPVALNAWNIVEIHIKIADSGGVLEIRLNGLSEGTFTGDTKPGTDVDINQLRWQTTGGQSGTLYFDDIVVNDPSGSYNNAWPNGLSVVLLKPSANGATNEWTPSAGSNYSCVDEVPISESDYVKTNAVDKLDLYTLEDLASEAYGVAAVRVDAWAARTAGSTPTKMALAARIGGNNYSSADKDIPVVYGLVSNTWETSPATNNPWTAAEVNAMEAGMKSRA